MTVGSTIKFGRVVIQLVRTTMDNAILGRNVSNLILIIRTVHSDIVMEVLSYPVVPSQSKFNTCILNVTTVDVRSPRTCSGKDRSLYQPVLGVFHVKIRIHAQTAVKETCINTYIVLFGSFPFHVFIGQTTGISAPYMIGRTEACTKQIIGSGTLDGSRVLVIVDVLVTDLSPADTKFQEVEPLTGTFHKCLVRKGPTSRYGREIAKAVTAGKFGRTVGTHSSIDHVCLFPIPSQTGKVGNSPGLIVRLSFGTQSLFGSGSGTIVDKSMVPIIKTFFQHTASRAYIGTLITARFHTDQSIERMIPQSPVILCSIGPYQCQTVVHILVDFGVFCILRIDIKLIKRSIAAVFTGAIRSAKHRADFQVLDRSQFCIYITGESSSLILVIGICHHVTVRIAVGIIPVAVAGIIVRIVIQIIVTIYRAQRRCGKCTA